MMTAFVPLVPPRVARVQLPPQGSAGQIAQSLLGEDVRVVSAFQNVAAHHLQEGRGLDCDVLEADGGTRTAAITGAYVALCRAVAKAAGQGRCKPSVVCGQVAAVSVGLVDGRTLLDLDYSEDSNADVDMNIAMTGDGRFVEVQGTSERQPFDAKQMDAMIRLARRGIGQLLRLQREAIEAKGR